MPTAHPFAVILPAAGTGSRFGGGDKLLAPLTDPAAQSPPESVLQRTFNLFARHPDVSIILIVTAPDRFEPYRAHLAENSTAPKSGDLLGRLAFAPGGRERWESVLFGLRHLAALSAAPEFVAIHDAARPLCPAAVIDAAFRAAIDTGGAVPCVAEPATLKRRGPDGCVAETVNRRGLFQAQTPQCFLLSKLLQGYESLLASNQLHDITDDAQIFERMAWPVRITDGSPLNLKITTADDVEIARAIVQSQRGL